jgi:hypothetical protein
MAHEMTITLRHKEAEAVVRQGNGDAATYRIQEWHDGTYEVHVTYHGKWCGLHNEIAGDGNRLNAQEVRDFLWERLGESALEVPAYLRRHSAFAA